MSDYYQDKIEEIKVLMKTDIHKAIFELSNELSMPYVPEIYEKTFREMHVELGILANEELSNKSYAPDEIIDLLWSDNPIKEVIAIENLKSSNLRDFESDIKKWIETKGPEKNISKAFLYELLVAQEINLEIHLLSSVLNPAIDRSLFDNSEIRRGFIEIQRLASKEPTLEKAVMEEFERYFLIKFPTRPHDGVAFATMIFNIVRSMLDGTTILSAEELCISRELNSI